MARQKYKLPNDPTEYNVNVESEQGQQWLKDNPNAQLVGGEQGNTQSSVEDATAEQATTASESLSETGSSDSQDDKALLTEEALTKSVSEELIEEDEQNPHLKQFDDLNMARQEAELPLLDMDNYGYNYETGWSRVGEGESIPVNEEDPEHGEAIKILEEKRLRDKEKALGEMPEVSTELMGTDESDISFFGLLDDDGSLNQLQETYSKYGFTFEEDSSWGDSIKVKSKDGAELSVDVDNFLTSNDAKSAAKLNAFLKEHASYVGDDAAEGMADATELTVDQRSKNKGKASEVVNKMLNDKAVADTFTAEDYARESQIKEEERKLMLEEGVSGYEGAGLIGKLEDRVDKRYKELGIPRPSTLRETLKNNASRNNFDVAKMILAKRRYAEEAGLNSQEVKELMATQDISEISKGDINLQSIYDGIQNNDEQVVDITKRLTESDFNNKTLKKNITKQIEALDGAWGNLFTKTDFQKKLERDSGEKLKTLDTEKKKVIAEAAIVKDKYNDIIAVQKDLMTNIDVEGTQAKIEEIQSRNRSTEEIDNIEAEIKKISQGEYTTQQQADNAQARIDNLISERQSLVDQYNESINSDQAEMQELVRAQQNYIDQYNQNAEELKLLQKSQGAISRKLSGIEMDEEQFSEYTNLMGKNHQLGTQMTNSAVNASIDLLQGIEQFTYMVNPFGEISDYLLEEGHITDPFLRDVITAGKLATGQAASVDWDRNPDTPTVRDMSVKAVNDWQESYRERVQDAIAFEDIENASDAGEWFGTMFAAQVPQLALMAATGGTGGLVLMGASSAGQKFSQMDEERQLFKSSGGKYGYDADFWTMMGVSLASGTFEALSERVTLGQMKYVKSGLRMGVSTSRKAGVGGFINYLSKHVITPGALLHTGKDMLQEGGSEFLATLGTNILDKYVVGKDIGVFDGGLESFVSGTLISSTMKTPLLFNSMYNPFKSVSARDALDANRQRLETLNRTLNTKKNSLSVDQIESIQDEIGQILAINKNLIAEDLGRVDLLSDKQKTDLVRIDNTDRKLKNEYNKLKNNKNLDPQVKERRSQSIIKKYQANQKSKNDILNSVKPKDVVTHQANQQTLIDQTNAQIKEMGGDVEIKSTNVTNDQMKALEVDSMISDAQEVISNPASTPKQRAEAKKQLKALQQARQSKEGIDAAVGEGNTYGGMIPTDKGFNIYINKALALTNGKISTKAHEFVHAVLHKTLKGDPATRLRLGSKIGDLLQSNKLKFKSERAEQVYKSRIANYDSDVRGEEMLAIASEMLADGDLEFNDGLIQKFKDIIRNFAQQRLGYDMNFNNANDVRNFLKDFHKSVKSGQANRAISQMTVKGAKGKLIDGQTAKSRIKFFKSVEANIKSNPDLMQTFDKFTKTEDGNPKHQSAEDFELSPDRTEAYFTITDGKALDGLIQQGMTELGLPPEALRDFTREVKEELGRRFLQNYNYDTNKSLFGWLTGVSGGAGKSIIYRAKGDVMNRYKKSQAADTVSADAPIGEGSSLSDVIQDQRDSSLEALDDADLTPGRKAEAQQVINELKAREVLEFSDQTNTAIDNAIKEAGVPLDGLNYKDVKAFLSSAEKITKKDKNGNTIIDKKTGKPKLFKATKTGDVKPSGPLFKVLDAVSKEFGVDPLRILADQDLNTKQRKAAQQLIYNKSVNPDGSFNNQLFELLPEGDTRSGIATGVANTKLGDFYVKGQRAAMAEGATAAGKPLQNKRTDVSMQEFLGRFGLQADGSTDASTRNDGAIRALVVQMAQLEANQQMRVQAMQSGSVSDAVMAKLGEGRGEMVFSKEASTSDIQEFHQQVSNSGLDVLDIAAAADRVFGDSMTARQKNKLVNNTYNQVQDFKQKDLALKGKFTSISGKDLLNVFTENRAINSHVQGVKKMLAKILPLNDKGKPINPGTIANTKQGLNTQRGHIVNSTKDLVQQVGSVAEAARLMIAHGISSFAGSGKMGDGRYMAETPGGKVIDTPGWEGPNGLKWKRNEDGSFKLDAKGNKIARENRQQVTSGKADYVALINKGLPKGYSIDISGKVGEYVLVSPDGSRTTLETSLPKESTKALFTDIKNKGVVQAFNDRKKASLEARQVAKTILDLAWSRVNSNDSFDAGDFGLLVMSLGSNMNGPLRKAAYADRVPSNYKALVSKYGLDAVGKIFQYEHGTPKEAVASKIIDSYINNNEMTDDVWDNYTVQVIHKKLDNLIDASGNKFTERQDGQPRAFNEDTLALVKSLTKQELSEIAPLISLDPSNPDIMGEAWITAANFIHSDIDSLPQEKLQKLKKGRRSGMWSKDTPTKGMSTFDFDETLIIDGENFVIATNPSTGKEVKISSDQWPIKGPELAQQGYEFDFSDFVNVRGGTDGPLLQKMKNQITKYGPDNVFVLTARMQDAAGPIHEWLKSKGINIPLKNITGLGKSEGSAKADWMLNKFSEGYNDMYFVDDAMPNVKAVKQVLDALDIKSKVVQAKMKFSKEGGIQFNEMLQRNTGVPKDKIFSDAAARARGSKAGGFRFFVPPSAEDFKGLLYNFLGKGKQGDADMAFFKQHLLDPFSKGIRNINTAKQVIANEFSELRKTHKALMKTLNDTVGDTAFTRGDAVRVYLWNKNGIDVPGLSPLEIAQLSDVVRTNPELSALADKIGVISRAEDGYVKPTENWTVGSIASDLNEQTSKVNRADFLAEWLENKNVIFSPENMNKIEAVYGTDFRDALENMLQRMETGTNRLTGSKDKTVNGFLDWINGSVGAVMFFNSRSAVLQTLSTVNFINWNDNNIFKAAAAFANQKQYWSDFMTLFNSDMLKQRRAGMSIDVNLSELTNTIAKSGPKDKYKAAVRYLLQIGFTPTQIADSFAIASGGATFYRNKIKKYLKEGMSQKDAEAKAFEDFQEIAEETQQSSRPDLISQQQAGVLGRLILAWQNTPMQYTRLTKKAISDLVNGRGDWKAHVSRIMYYGAMQNVIFGSLQSGLAFLMFGGDEEEEKTKTKVTRVANGALDTILRGTGVYGAMASTIKNTIMKYYEESEKPYGKRELSKVGLELIQLSPPIGSKIRKIMKAVYSKEFNEGVPEKMGFDVDNPALDVVGNVIEAATNVPVARVIRKAQNIEEIFNSNNEDWKRIALLLGWDKWSLNIEDEDLKQAKEEAKQERKEKKKEEDKKKKEEEKIKKEEENKAKGINTVRCSATKSNGERCKIMVETKNKTAKCGYHKSYKPNEGSDRDGDGIKEYQCKATTSSGRRCRNRTENENKKCYAHQ